MFFLYKSPSRESWLNFFKSILAWQPFTFHTRTTILDTETKLLQDIQPYILPPLKASSSSKLSMGLKRLNESNWLTLDSNYLPENALRKNFLRTSRPNVLQTPPISIPACHETLSLVTAFLTTRFPQHFTLSHNKNNEPIIQNHLTDETFNIGPNCENPLATAARLAMEDFNILMKDEVTGEYNLQASATLFPAGWKLEERIGTSMENLHKPVPQWQEKLGGIVNR